MTTEEILHALNRREQGKRPTIYPVWEAVVYYLYKLGYHRRYIADAMGVFPDSISYAIRLAEEHFDIKDNRVVRVFEDCKNHKLEILPHFEMIGKGETSKIKTDLYIDGIKYKK